MFLLRVPRLNCMPVCVCVEGRVWVKGCPAVGKVLFMSFMQHEIFFSLYNGEIGRSFLI